MKQKLAAVLAALAWCGLVAACDDDTGTETGTGNTRSVGTNCPVAGGGTSGTVVGGGTSTSGGTTTGEGTATNEAVDDGDCTTAGSGTSSGTGTTTSTSGGPEDPPPGVPFPTR
ncbi:MAG: hypothetical protein KIT84_32730 [Labilithrix sp.]|nr:hypothetical protein [Labilithrix sp.]MCW5815841.1 hypothetical protein [Labilithrix sp.]